MNNVNLLAALQKKQQAAASSQQGPAIPSPILHKEPPKKEELASSSQFRSDNDAFDTASSSSSSLSSSGLPFEYRHDAFYFFTKNQSPDSFQTTWDASTRTITIPLAPCLYRSCDYTLSKREPIKLRRVVAKLGVLRCLHRENTVFNAFLLHSSQQKERKEEGQEDDDRNRPSLSQLDETTLAKTRFMELLTNCGLYQSVLDLILKHHQQQHGGSSHGTGPPVTVTIDALGAFLQTVDDNAMDLAAARTLVQKTGTTNFYPGLGELFPPGTRVVSYPASLYGSPLGSTVVQSWYNEEEPAALTTTHRQQQSRTPTTTKTKPIKRSFVLVIEFVVSVGTKLVTVAATDVYPDFPNAISLRQLSHKLLLLDHDNNNNNHDISSLLLFQRLQRRGNFYAQVATSPTYIHYNHQSFYPNRSSRPLAKAGRVMVDVHKGIANAILPVVSSNSTSSSSSSSDALADTVKEAIKVWESHVRTGIHVPFRDSDETSYWQCWPVLTGFSFTARQWGKFVLELPTAASDAVATHDDDVAMTTDAAAASGNCQFIEFQQKAFDQLVLADDKKELIRAVARNAGLSSSSPSSSDHAVANDVVADKGGASIFLLHGPPGCGKTLTAEAIAELLHKPLYIVTAGDLGITAAEVEKTFGDILELCQQWNALLLIDEADVFLEARMSLEIQRNALVCVMLRLLEYYSGCLFLSSNRSAANIDAAIASRITVMLDYPALNASGRAKVWRNLLELVPNRHFADDEDMSISCDRLGVKYEMNGRQIKNSIVLARALARERNDADVTMELLERAVAAVAGPAAAVTDPK